MATTQPPAGGSALHARSEVASLRRIVCSTFQCPAGAHPACDFTRLSLSCCVFLSLRFSLPSGPSAKLLSSAALRERLQERVLTDQGWKVKSNLRAGPT